MIAVRKGVGLLLITANGRRRRPACFRLQLSDVFDAHRAGTCFRQASLAAANCALKGLFALLGRLGAIPTSLLRSLLAAKAYDRVFF